MKSDELRKKGPDEMNEARYFRQGKGEEDGKDL
jgi:hypothetical protein